MLSASKIYLKLFLTAKKIQSDSCQEGSLLIMSDLLRTFKCSNKIRYYFAPYFIRILVEFRRKIISNRIFFRVCKHTLVLLPAKYWMYEGKNTYWRCESDKKLNHSRLMLVFFPPWSEATKFHLKMFIPVRPSIRRSRRVL